MTREEAYYLKILLLSGFRADYEEELNGYLEAEEPISDIVLTLAFLGSDIEKVIYELGCYCGEESFDADKSCDLLRLFLKQAYESKRLSKEEIVHQMYRFAMKHEDLFDSDSKYWDCMYWMYDYFYLAEDGILSKEDFDRLFYDFLNEGKLYR